MLDPELKKNWIMALRSGEFRQGIGKFKNFRGDYCCLGVLCEVAGIPIEYLTGSDNYTGLKDLGFPQFLFNHYFQLNDGGNHNFCMIANEIEKDPNL